ncbi:MAG: hypothetical protein U1E60_15880 [Reyranellaceae bacterium]
MTIGSAAFRAGTLPQAPLSPFHSFRQNRHPPAMPRIMGAAAPPSRLPVAGLADDPPRGRILVVEDDASLVLDLQRLLREGGYRAVGPASSLEEAERLIAQRPIDATVLDLQLRGCETVADSLAYRGVPFLWLTNSLRDELPKAHARVPAVAKPSVREKLIGMLEQLVSHASVPSCRLESTHSICAAQIRSRARGRASPLSARREGSG